MAFVLVPCAVFADDDAVVYDAADFPCYSGRTMQDVMQKYTEATAKGDTYIDSQRSTYYDVPASTSAPYAAGVLKADTLEAMEGMTNFYRWLIGVNDLTVNTESNRSLQAQALDRNFQFDHVIQNSSKPDDMDDELWQEGFACNHNILAGGYTPSGAVTGWLNEGYSLNNGTWDTVGHRTAILNAGYRNIEYACSGGSVRKQGWN